jgi:flagellar hook-associated protein 1 FlgK
MPVSTFFGLQTSLRGLLAHQRALDVTGHNVANASTIGYSRQEAVLSASTPLVLHAGAIVNGRGAQLGSGVEVETYRRIRDTFLDVQFRAQNTILGEANAKASALEGVELALAEPGETGLATQLDKFWSLWSTLTGGNAGSQAARQALISQAQTVAEAFADIDRQLQMLAAQAAAEFNAITQYDPATGTSGEIGNIARELAQVGEAIRRAVAAGQTPNDLLDQRDLLLDQLSEYGTVQVVDLGDGGVQVFFGGVATPLVDDSLVDDPMTPGDDRVSFSAAALVTPGGKLGALKALSEPGGIIDTYRTELAAIAQGLADAVNAIHATGPSGLDFFAFDPALGASGLTVAVDATTVEPSSDGSAGAGDIALQISQLKGGAVDQAYAAFVARIGTDTKQNLRTLENAKILVNAVEDRRQSVMGVSLDEEMANLMRFQRGYQASARTMTTLDEMLETLITRTGRVGL